MPRVALCALPLARGEDGRSVTIPSVAACGPLPRCVPGSTLLIFQLLYCQTLPAVSEREPLHEFTVLRYIRKNTSRNRGGTCTDT